MGSHRVTEVWQGTEVETLEDLLRPGLRCVCVGINPSPVSVDAGHYYQGRLGKLFFSRLTSAGVMTSAPNGEEDDAAFADGIGFTDIVKRPSPRANEIRPDEFEAGRELLVEKLEHFKPALVIFTFKKTATVLCGAFDGHGFVDGVEVASIPAFVMPGPYERADRVARALDSLAESQTA